MQYPITKKRTENIPSGGLRPLVLSTCHLAKNPWSLRIQEGDRDLLPEKHSLIAMASFWGLWTDVIVVQFHIGIECCPLCQYLMQNASSLQQINILIIQE